MKRPFLIWHKLGLTYLKNDLRPFLVHALGLFKAVTENWIVKIFTCGLGLTPPPCGLNPNFLFFEGFPKSILCADGKLFTYKILRPILLQFDAVWSWVVFVICFCYGEDDILLLLRMFHCAWYLKQDQQVKRCDFRESSILVFYFVVMHHGCSSKYYNHFMYIISD